MSNLKKIREEKGLSLTQLSQKSGVPVSKLRDIEEFGSQIPHEIAEKIIGALGITIFELNRDSKSDKDLKNALTIKAGQLDSSRQSSTKFGVN